MGGVDAAVGWVGVDSDSDVSVRAVHDVGPVAGAVHEGAGERGDALTTADVLANLGPASERAAHDITDINKETTINHLLNPAVGCGTHSAVEGE